MANYAQHLKKPIANQTTKSRNDQIKNSAGGYVYQANDWNRLDRFLILGCDKGTYYAKEKKLAVENAAHIKKLLDKDYKRVIDRVVEISTAGRAPKEDPALFVLALALSSEDVDTKRYAGSKLPEIARTGTHLFTVVDFADGLRRWGRSLRKAVANWYNTKTAKDLAFQVVKYQSRTKEGSQTWSQLDVLKKAHVKPKSSYHSAVMKWIRDGWTDEQVAAFEVAQDNPFNIIYAHEKAKRATKVKEIVSLIEEFGLVRESIPTNFLNTVDVWVALLQKMPLNALCRNLGKMTSIGVLGSFAPGNSLVCSKLRDVEYIRKGRLHPITILNAIKVYTQGHGEKGKLTWKPVQAVLDALNDAFYASFKTLVPSGKNVLIALDCSGSMDASPCVGMSNLSAKEASAAMALSVANSEVNHIILGFACGGNTTNYRDVWNYGGFMSDVKSIAPISISPGMRLDSAIKTLNKEWKGGRTDCSLPMLYAIEHNLDVQVFVIFTDSETYAGKIHVDEALRQYRRKSGNHNAKLVVCSCTATPFTIGDPQDPGVLEVQGFDSACPNLISDFISDAF